VPNCFYATSCNAAVTNHIRNTKDYAGIKPEEGILILRMDAPVYFGNAQYLEDKLDELLEDAEKAAEAGTAGEAPGRT
jgi:MFS superfamily sulfate permease-like transporter